ncbi:L-lactate permease [Arthrobacter sp. 179]|uniref:L-lactate permease n=1 Tax=Arthrobacter sp. 179 TaxID=3457734 RepID=UPI0026546779|nr:L-lactate permease [Micrococcaceae bacterium]
MLAVAAAVPIVLAGVLFFLGIRSTRISVWSLAVGLVVALLFFPTPWSVVAGSLGAFAPTIIEILLILYAGVLLSRIMSTTGAMASISGWLRSSAPSRRTGTLLVVFGIVPFAESVTGFGIGVTVGVPILRLIGHSVPRSTIFSLLGLLAVPWGALGPGTLLASELSGTSLLEVGIRSAIISLPVMLGAALLVTFLLRHEGSVGRLFGGAVASALLLWAGILGANILLGTPLAGVMGSLFPIAGHLLVYRWRGSLVAAGWVVARAALPYAVMAAGLLTTRAVVSSLGETQLGLRAISSPATWLVCACLVAHFGPGQRNGSGGPETRLRRRAASAFGTWLPVGVVTFCFTVLGSVLASTGMGAELGTALAAMGGSYLVIAPAVNALAGFITGSNTAANAMLTATQTQVATELGSSVLQMVAATNVAASMATMAAPSRLLLAYELAVATPVGAPTGGGAGGRPEDPLDAESAVNRWVLPRIFGLLIVVSAVLGLVTWVLF